MNPCPPLPSPPEPPALDPSGPSTGFRSGFIALVGRPNVGKSTLLNRLVGQKVAITSPVAQTTRRRLRGIHTTPGSQFIFVDTPGIHKPHHLLGERLVRSARDTIGEVDLVLLLVNGSEAAGRGDAFIVNLLRQARVPVHVALNHWDNVPSSQADHQLASYRELLAEPIEEDGSPPHWPLHPISALTGLGTETLLASLEQALPVGPCLYPPETVSDQSESALLAELIREQVLHHTREEVPHSVAVHIDRIVDDERPGPKGKTRVAVLATVLVERHSQKVILIGRGGQMLRTIGSGARKEMEALLNTSVYLELFVKVVPNWRRSSARLAELGYGGSD
ncbi:MAG: GTPase Era [Cyanobacteria bacterium K_Offshore_surface_m2_239]|nr:GTPase Era [Cyanobacteria bacterium K_Offshore_surface_m2_239]